MLKKAKPQKQKKSSALPKVSFPIAQHLSINNNILQHDYSKKDAWVESEYLDNVIMHTAGAVVHSLKEKIHCDQCLSKLTESPT